MNYKKEYYKYYGLDVCDVLYCKHCGRIAVNLHHLKHKSACGSDHPLNLIPLCFTCHFNHHNKNNPTTEQLIKKNI